MLGQAHMALGAACGLALMGVCPCQEHALWTLPVALVAGGLPDVLDCRNAAGRGALALSWSGISADAGRIRRGTRRVGCLQSILRLAAGHLLLLPRVLAALCLDLIARTIPHRGLTHWALTWLLLSIMVLTGITMFSPSARVVGLAFSAGYLSHILGDMLTLGGVPVLGPFCRRRLHLLPRALRFRFDAPVQWLIVAGACGAAWSVGSLRLLELLGDLL